MTFKPDSPTVNDPLMTHVGSGSKDSRTAASAFIKSVRHQIGTI
jgi:hypothetical protein